MSQKSKRTTTPPAAGGWGAALQIAGSVLIVVVVGILAYGNVGDGGFLLDDQAIIVMNPHIRSLGNIPSLFTMNWWEMSDVPAAGNLYRPLAAATYAVDIGLLGAGGAEGELYARVMHYSSLFYHVCVCVLVWLLLYAVLSPGRLRVVWAGLGAALFAAHPVHAEAVTNVVGRAEVLAALFMCGAALAWLRGTRGQADRAGWLCGAAGLWFLAMLCKEMAVTLPVLLVGVDLLRRRRRSWQAWAIAYGPFVLLMVVYMVARRAALGEGMVQPYEAMPASKVSTLERWFTMSHAFAVYARLLVAPVGLSADYSGFPVVRSSGEPRVSGSLLLHALLIGGAVYGMWRWRGRRDVVLIGVGILGTYLAMFPVSNFLISTGVIISERALYIPSFFFVLAVAAGCSWGAARMPGRGGVAALAGLGAVAIVAATLGCRSANEAWVDRESLFGAAVANPYCGHIGFTGMARSRMNARDYEGALVYLRQAHALRSNVVTLDYMARCHMGLKRYGEAAPLLEALVRHSNGRETYVHRLAQCYRALGREGDAKKLQSRFPPGTHGP